MRCGSHRLAHSGNLHDTGQTRPTDEAPLQGRRAPGGHAHALGMPHMCLQHACLAFLPWGPGTLDQALHDALLQPALAPAHGSVTQLGPLLSCCLHGLQSIGFCSPVRICLLIVASLMMPVPAKHELSLLRASCQKVIYRYNSANA